ncbi:helix-turn-helix domain-containing protein [Propionibacterium freudenreichii]|uniref:helix-turn-helix transcriptional regulator n=1 Tax=Propionibacterium freudenreichii TaxID=1744 RepID=UPI00243444AB|nr:helix-turn-helix domain-containing protein [Propionibacterium freudenreichii]WFF32430.1 helix-turn-helix domain-containing protein [Propionibacterium freudenreichii]
MEAHVEKASDLQLLTPEELSGLVKVDVATLVQWRHRRQGPPFVKVGRLVRYRVDDVRAWIDGGGQ